MNAGRLGLRVAALVIATMTGVSASTPGGTAIVNAVSATYTDGTHTFATQSNTVQTTVASVSALSVTPKEAAVNPQTDSYPQNAPVTRTFTIANTSNIADAYTLTSVTASAGSVTSVAFVTGGTSVATSAGGTASPLVQPGSSIAVVVTVATASVALGTPIAIAIVARTTVAGTQTGLVSDGGKQWAVSVGVPQLGGVGTPGATVAKTVDGVPSESNVPGGSLTYAIAFQNWGTVAATNAKLTDNVPAGLHPDPASAQLNGAPVAATLTGQVLTVALGTIAPNVPMTVTFRATVDAAQTLGTSFVNVASLSADGVATLATSPAGVFVGVSNIVFDGIRGAKAPVSGALVELVDSKTNALLSLGTLASGRSTASVVQSASSAVNPNNANPMRTGATGAYGWTIPSPAAGTTLTFDIVIAASGYQSRRIGAVLTPEPNGVLYDVTLTSKDGQPLASAGGYALTTTAVQIANVFSLLGNLPLFDAQSISVTKTADKTQASPGDRVGYTVTFSANGTTVLGATTVTDALPAGLAYAPGTARLDGVASEPVVHGNSLVWTLTGLQPGASHAIAYECVILPAVAAGTTLTNGVTVNGAIPGTQLNATGSGSVSVVTVDGAFTTQGAITGRVFIDDAGTGHFRSGDRVVEGARLYLESGEAVVTDRTGRFSFPGVRGGMHVLRLDETTLPANARAFADRSIDSPRSPIRLIHGTLDMGQLYDVNFALEPVR